MGDEIGLSDRKVLTVPEKGEVGLVPSIPVGKSSGGRNGSEISRNLRKKGGCRNRRPTEGRIERGDIGPKTLEFEVGQHLFLYLYFERRNVFLNTLYLSTTRSLFIHCINFTSFFMPAANVE